MPYLFAEFLRNDPCGSLFSSHYTVAIGLSDSIEFSLKPCDYKTQMNESKEYHRRTRSVADLFTNFKKA